MQLVRSTSDAPAPRYVFVLVDPTTGLPSMEMFWTRDAAREYRQRNLLVEYKVRRAKLTVFNK